MQRIPALERSRFIPQGIPKTGHAGTTAEKRIESGALPPATSAQKAAISALELAERKKINIWTGSKYDFGVLQAQGAVRREQGLLPTEVEQGEQAKYAEQIPHLSAVRLPAEDAAAHCQGHLKGNPNPETGNRSAETEAKRAAESTSEKQVLASAEITL